MDCKEIEPVNSKGNHMGMIQRDDMEWEVGGGFRIGNSGTPVADSCQCTAKPIQYCKVKKIKNKEQKNPQKTKKHCLQGLTNQTEIFESYIRERSGHVFKNLCCFCCCSLSSEFIRKLSKIPL